MFFKRIAIVLASLLFWSTAAFAGANAWIETSSETTQPLGHYNYCQEAPAECQQHFRNAPVRFTNEVHKVLQQVLTRVDKQIITRVETGPDVWTHPTKITARNPYGDCEEHVLLARHILLNEYGSLGFHLGNTRPVLVVDGNGGDHLVLAVTTDMGDFILDNLLSEVRDWRDTPHQEYVKMVSSWHAGRWVNIVDTRFAQTASK